ncbi:hypothetical protein GGI25_003500 [Coemansia spiralis]|uniref:Amino acid transporter transmembrane domain-containing protein n=2 Tax=Coemansia TaxID=4863 RepID=A0A9W8KY41_9FUNG|nr:hypothetical protein EDC05_003442 [Coemansia umbellata]KAJ2621528.1 hypothetical protein GGI26_003991 [Coemansia sp. RSA 1358]KAJ2676748.1 hypothetical protein GGI25_003500 [Coemansia spiralis]
MHAIDSQQQSLLPRQQGSSESNQNTYGAIQDSSPDETNDTQVRRCGSSVEAFFHIVCITAGTGILQLPYTFKAGGWAGVLYIVLAAAVAAYNGDILIKCLYYKQGVRLRSYSEVAEAAFGRHGQRVVRLLKDINVLGVVVIYIVLAGVNINSLLAGTAAGSFGAQFWSAVSTLLVWIVIVFAREVHDVFVLSVFGTMTTVVMVIIIIWLGVSDIEFAHARPPTKLVDLKMAPISLASICFSFGGNLNWPDVEASMKSPKLWSRTLSLATVFVTFIYVCVAVVGYGVYGDLVKSPVLLSLPPGIAVVIANVMITAHVLLACPIMLTAVFIEAEDDLRISLAASESIQARLYCKLLRTLLMSIVAFFAVLVADFSKVIPILGAIAASMVVFVIPVACYIRLFRTQRAFSKWEYAWCGMTICIGFTCLIIGTSQAITDLYK